LCSKTLRFDTDTGAMTGDIRARGESVGIHGEDIILMAVIVQEPAQDFIPEQYKWRLKKN
jgi:hypothetical protein